MRKKPAHPGFMREWGNTQRTARAAVALTSYVLVTCDVRSLRDLDPGDLEDEVADLLADLLHFAVTRGFDPTALVRRAVNNFESERNGEPE